MSFAQLRGQANQNLGAGSIESTSGSGTEETNQGAPITLDIESLDPFGGSVVENEVENDAFENEEDIFEEEVIVEEEAPIIEEEAPVIEEEAPIIEEAEELPVAGGWEPVDLRQAQNNPDFNTVYDYSVAYAMEQAYQATLLPPGYNSKKVIKAWKKEDNGLNYKIDCEVYDKDNNVATVSVLSYYDKETNSREMLNFTYGYKYVDEENGESQVNVGWTKESAKYAIDVIPTKNPNYYYNQDAEPQKYDLDLAGYLALGGYNPVPADEVYNDQALNNYVVYGAQYIVKYGKDKGYLNNDYAYNVGQIYSIYGQWNEEKTNKWYRCEIELTDGAGSSAVASYEVHFEAEKETPEIPTLGFKRIQNS